MERIASSRLLISCLLSLLHSDPRMIVIRRSLFTGLLVLLAAFSAQAQVPTVFAWPGATLYDATAYTDPVSLTNAIADGTLTEAGYDAVLLPAFDDANALGNLVAAAHQQNVRVALQVTSAATPGPNGTASATAQTVAAHGIDALFLTDDLGPDATAQLHTEAAQALATWQTAQKTSDPLKLWLVSPAPHPAADAYVTAASSDDMDTQYTAWATAVNDGTAHPMHHITLDAATSPEALTMALLAPGSVLLTETDDADPAIRDLAKQLLAFRHRHAALALGQHEQIETDPYAFYRGVQVDMTVDKVIAVVGASGRTRINVSRVFPDDTALRDALSGKISMVSYGMVSFRNTGNSILLLEVAE